MPFISNRRRVRTLAAVALLVVAPAITACGFDAQTEKVYQPAEGVNVTGNDIDVLGAVVVSSTPGSGIFVASLNNNTARADQIVSVEAAGSTVPVTVGQDIPAGSLLNLAMGKPKGVAVSEKSIQAGGYVRIQLTFEHSAPVVVNAPVVDNSAPYNDILPSATPDVTAGG